MNDRFVPRRQSHPSKSAVTGMSGPFAEAALRGRDRVEWQEWSVHVFLKQLGSSKPEPLSGGLPDAIG